MLKAINWGKVIYNEEEKKLVFFDQNVVRIPEALINLFHDKIQTLDLSNNKIQHLNALENFSNLDELILDNNMITEDVIFPDNSPSCLRVLSLNNNRIKRIELLATKLEKAFPNLEYLSLLGNTACPYFFLNLDFDSYYDYRLHVISHLKHLRFLDCKRVTKIERQMATKKSIKILETESAPTSMNYNNNTSMDGLSKFWPSNWLKRETKSYTPLPESKPRNPKVAYGKLNYKYVGKESEGNRFIMNNDL